MSDVAKQSLEVLRRVAEFIEQLPDDQIADLAAGRATLAYIPLGSVEPVVPKKPRKAARKSAPKIDTETLLAQLRGAPSRDDGHRLIAGVSLADLRALAAAAGMTGVSKTPRAELAQQLINLTVGGRLSFAAMRDL